MIDLNKIQGLKAKHGRVLENEELATKKLHFPVEYIELVIQSNGLEWKDGIIYSVEDIEERNQIFEIGNYLPDFCAIGDDGGGRVLLLPTSDTSPYGVYLVDVSDLQKENVRKLSESLAQWIDEGMDFDAPDNQSLFNQMADLYLDCVPPRGITELLTIKNEFKLSASVHELKSKLENTPTCIVSNFPYMRLIEKCRRINAKGKCLSLRKHGSQEVKLPD